MAGTKPGRDGNQFIIKQYSRSDRANPVAIFFICHRPETGRGASGSAQQEPPQPLGNGISGHAPDPEQSDALSPGSSTPPQYGHVLSLAARAAASLETSVTS